ncbi:hypothetical protein ACHQM5_000293 [Ranunculus cassubicifolius]
MSSGKRGRRRPKLKKEEIAEDFCFVCKDGGELFICDYKECMKAYHPHCVEKDKEFLDSGKRWVCGWHKCFNCSKTATLHCFGCTDAVCKKCISSSEFVCVKGNKGFCANCLNLALLATQNVDVDSDGVKIDFKDKNTYECLFKEYWEIINEKEGLTLEDLRSAEVRLKKGVWYKDESDSEEGDKDDQDFDDNMDGNAEIDTVPITGKELKVSTPRMRRRKSKSKKREFDGWGSKVLRDFLKSIGKDSSFPISQNEVGEIIDKYIRDNKLIDSDRKKKVNFDANLVSVFGKKTVNRHKINELLESHFAENLEESENDELSYSSDDKDNGTDIACKRQRTSLSRKTEEKEKALETPRSPFASITTNNIKLVYLKRSLVEDLCKSPETFDDKVMGTFVRVKSDPNDYFQKNEYQLLQVTGITKVQGTNNVNQNVTLHVSSMRKGFQIHMLSDEDFSEEEVEDLRKRVKDGLLKKLMTVELEGKARSLHEDLTKHWINKELIRLKYLSDRANEKGWRRELYEYLERVKLLKTDAEQQRLLKEIPKVTAEELELDNSPRSILLRSDSMPDAIPGPNDAICVVGDDTDKRAVENISGGIGNGIIVNTSMAVEQDWVVVQNSVGTEVFDHDAIEKATTLAVGVQDWVVVQDSAGTEVIEDDTIEKASELAVGYTADVTLDAQNQRETDDMEKIRETRGAIEAQNQFDISMEGGSRNSSSLMPNLDTERGNGGVVFDNANKDKEIIDLDSDDEEGKIWYYMDPDGITQGPFDLSQLKCWQEGGYFEPSFEVWKVGQSREQGILLTHVLQSIFG